MLIALKTSTRTESLDEGTTARLGLSAFGPEYEAGHLVNTSEDLWERAAKILLNDEDKKKLWLQYLELLKTEHGLELSSDVTNRQQRLCTLLDSKKRDLLFSFLFSSSFFPQQSFFPQHS
jgi:hypothetical protein